MLQTKQVHSVYADETYYKETYKGTIITQDIERSLKRASEDVNSLCYGRIEGKGFENLTEFQQDRIQDAVCEQAEYTFKYGEYFNNPMKSYSVGTTSVQLQDTEINGVHTTSRVIQLLEDTGLRCLTL